MFKSLDVSSMNETDVREAIVRPLLNALGYRHGTKANIRTELTLRYDQSFLGRKAPGKDPKLQGRADYVCEVIPYGRWIVEVKSPANDLTQAVRHLVGQLFSGMFRSEQEFTPLGGPMQAVKYWGLFELQLV